MIEDNEYRIPLAWMLLLFGVLFVAIGLALLLYQARSSESAVAAESRPAMTPVTRPSPGQKARALAMFLMYTTLIVLVVGAGVYLLHRWARRLRRRSRPRHPTETADAWAEHRLPEDDDDGGPGARSGEEHG